ncbi:putative Succinate-semialdehyde dehydrogenase [Glarea lozoyensis 74030]|uniref:Succinate-semialdehyde dehydrogenase, mitochondrial n=1 Tax=Glarea lozoyensis (strain ATCC 74030 / MF5533) TaxID=1104152 RepID=H0EI39_GLAL7|nr:putative Succinate-semialdehyde dehydrogenase [Glarea lozoyensis 74030]
MPHSVPKLNDPSLFKTDVAYVNGEWVKAKSGKTFEVFDPSSGKLIGTAPEMDAEDTKKAIDAAAAAFPSFRTTTGRERSKMLRKWYDLMVENSEDIARLITWENGKPLADAKGEATYAANFFEWFSEEAPRIYGDTIPASIPGNRIVTIKEPVGVSKSPGETPFTSLALAELAHRAGIPKGVVNIVSALKNTLDVGEVLTTSPIVKKVSFTGSTGVGKLLMKQSSSTLKKLSFELGGNAPFIVFDDADLDTAVAGAITSKFRSSGQTCVCANRLLIQSGIYDSFAEKFAAKVAEFKVGGGYEEGITHGPLIHDRAISKVDAHVRDAEKKGGKVIQGGQKMPELGENFFQPTVITGMTTDMALSSEETFGPVAGLFKFDTEDEVVKIANNTEVGLAGYFFSRDIQRIYRVAEALEVGMTNNQLPTKHLRGNTFPRARLVKAEPTQVPAKVTYIYGHKQRAYASPLERLTSRATATESKDCESGNAFAPIKSNIALICGHRAEGKLGSPACYPSSGKWLSRIERVQTPQKWSRDRRKQSTFGRAFSRSIPSNGVAVDKKGPLGLSTLHDPNDAIADLIFVHGLGGGSESTWTESHNGTLDPTLYWPKRWLPYEDGFSDVRIHSFGYDSNWKKESTLNIHDFAKSLLVAIMDSPAIIKKNQNVRGTLWQN